MKSALCICVLFTLLGSPLALADQVVLKNGDRLTGTIVKSDAKSLTFKSEFVGTVTIPLEAIDQISADQPLNLVLKDGQTIVGTVATREGKLEVRTADAGTVSVARESVETIRSKEAQAAYQQEIERLKNPRLLDLWSGSADAGLALARGNAQTATVNMGVNAARTSPRDKLSFYFTSLYSSNASTGETTTTANAKRGGIRYDLNVAHNVFGFGTADFESDEFQKLDLRTVFGGGLGWHAKKTDSATVDIFGGGALNKEYYSTPLNRTSGEALVGVEAGYKMSKRLTLKERTVFFPNVSESGQYRLNFDGSAAVALKTWLGWQLSLSDRYISNPVAGAKSNDVLVSTGLRLTFGK